MKKSAENQEGSEGSTRKLFESPQQIFTDKNRADTVEGFKFTSFQVSGSSSGTVLFVEMGSNIYFSILDLSIHENTTWLHHICMYNALLLASCCTIASPALNRASIHEPLVNSRAKSAN